MRKDPELEAQLREEDLARRSGEVALHLRLNRLPLAEKMIAELLAEWPDSTTVQELAGDVAAARGKLTQAREHYKRAMELEPANADAERKYGLALLTLSPEERRLNLIHQVIADPSARRPQSRKPLNAVLNALLFPGLGQLYNREHEKGLGMLLAGAFLLMLAFYLLIEVPYSAMAKASAGHRIPFHEQVDRAHQALAAMGTGYQILIFLCLLAYSLLYLWGIYDAWRKGQSENEKDLGIT